MKPVIVHLKLPEELGKRATEIARQPPVGMDSSPFTAPRAIRDVILEALREQWMPQLSDDERDDREEREMRDMADSYPTYGSIPSVQKRA